MRRIKIKASTRKALKRSDMLANMDLRYDYSRRLRNALMLLKQLTPHWRTWCRRNLFKRYSTASEAAKIAETKAADIQLKRSFRGMAFRPDRFMVTDNLALVEK